MFGSGCSLGLSATVALGWQGDALGSGAEALLLLLSFEIRNRCHDSGLVCSAVVFVD